MRENDKQNQLLSSLEFVESIDEKKINKCESFYFQQTESAE